MAGLEDAPETVHRAILGGIVLYFALIAYDALVGSPPAALASAVLFGFVALGVGGLLVAQSARATAAPTVAGAALIAGGAAQLAWVLTGEPVLDAVATVAVLIGISLYLYVVWASE